MGVERDWMQFLWNWNRRGPNNSNLREMTNVLKQTCSPITCVVGGNPDDASIPDCLDMPPCGKINATYATTEFDSTSNQIALKRNDSVLDSESPTGYQLEADGQCVRLATIPDGVYVGIGPEVPPSEFVAFTLD
jgi:hypothetical protein